MFTNKRSLNFKNLEGPRYGWFRKLGDFVPFTFSYLEDSEWKLIEQWYKETEEKHLIGEASVPFMSLLQAFVMGNSLSRVVQLGHYAGFSTLLLGFMLRKMGKKHGLVTVDIDPLVTEFTSSWVKKAGLSEYVKVILSDSSEAGLAPVAKDYLEGTPQMVIIDSSHQYAHTKKELKLWYENLETGGLLVLHDTSDAAIEYDSTKQGGVKKALNEWIKEENIGNSINIVTKATEGKDNRSVYMDICGVGIIQK